MKLYGWPSDLGACKFYRTALPMQALADIGHDVQVCDGTKIDRDVQDGTNGEHDRLVVAQRTLNPTALRVLGRWTTEGRPWVYDLDDALWAVEHDSPAWDFYSEQGAQDALSWTVANATVVTCSTEPLAAALRQRTASPVHVAHNALDAAHIQPDFTERPPVVFWRGSATHDRDVDLISYALRGAEKAGVRVVLAGQDYRARLGLRHAVMMDDLLLADPEWVDVARANSNLIRERGKGEKRQLINSGGRSGYVTEPNMKVRTAVWLDPSTYLRAVREVVRPTIALCPLRSSEFNDSKSHISALEAHAAGAAVLASDMPSFHWYLDGDDRHGGRLLANHPNDWRRALADMLDMSHTEWLAMAKAGAARATATAVDTLTGAYTAAYGAAIERDAR